MQDKTFKILAIDGGGIRGVFPAHILKCIQERLQINVYEKFDMFAGTSTGAIIAAGLAHKRSPTDIVSLYKNHGEQIFGNPVKSVWPRKLKQLFHSKFKNTNLKQILADEFTDTRLGDIEKPLLLPATDIGLGGVHVFKSMYHEKFTRDLTVLLRDAVLASCSAPTYFDPVKTNSYLLADGGIWANNPSIAAVLDAVYRIGVEQRDIRILSLGTGHSRSFYGTDIAKKWGLARGWERQNFIEFLLSLQAQSTQNYMKLLLKPHQLLRINFESDTSLPLDDFTKLDDFISRADSEFSINSEKINDFLSIN